MKLKSKIIPFSLLFFVGQSIGQVKQPVWHTPETEYQFSVALNFTQPNGKDKSSTNYLWVPPQCRHIKAVIVSSQNVLEQWLDEHPLIRKTCRENDIAILWSCPGFFIDIKEKSKQVNGKNIQTILDTLAAISGYGELKRVPWIGIGHSGTNNLVSELVSNNANKILAAFKMKGGPGFSNNTGVPVMCSAGEYFEWSQNKEDLIHPIDTIKNYQSILKDRKEKQQPLSYFFSPNTGHFECSEELTKLVADYIAAALKTRLVKGNDTLLIPVDLNKGWVAGLPLPGGVLMQPKMYKDAVGNEKNCPWYFTRQQAADAIALATADFKRKPQIAGFANIDGTPAGFYKGIVWPVPFTTGADGLTFTLNTVFLNAVPDTFKFAGTPLSHGKNEPNAILLCGNAKHITGNTFRLAPDRSYKAGATYFIVKTEGDKEYRTSVQPGQLTITSNLKGEKQVIDFAPIKDMPASTKKLLLKATATSGMPVSFFVKSGPVNVENNQLVFSSIPPAAKFPIKVTVVAYQWGRSASPEVQTAPFIERTFLIYK